MPSPIQHTIRDFTRPFTRPATSTASVLNAVQKFLRLSPAIIRPAEIFIPRQSAVPLESGQRLERWYQVCVRTCDPLAWGWFGPDEFGPGKSHQE